MILITDKQQFMTYFHLKFQMPSSNSSIVIIIKLKGQKMFSKVPCYFMYHKNTARSKAAYFLKICYHTISGH